MIRFFVLYPLSYPACSQDNRSQENNHFKKAANVLYILILSFFVEKTSFSYYNNDMSDFQELIKNIDKCRDYVRDFFVYGFKSRGDFRGKSARTYDDERRRIVSWLPDHIREDFTEGGKSKNISLQIDQKKLDTNPLFSIWQTKSFTSRDLSLHFFILKILEQADTEFSAAELTDILMNEYAYEADLQSVRRKCNEYVEEGLLSVRKEGKTTLYRREVCFSELPCAKELLDLICCFQMYQPLGIIGYTIMAGQNRNNSIYRVKHGFPAFTLEDEILLSLLYAIHNRYKVRVRIQSNRRTAEESSLKTGYPLQIFVSTRSGRRFICMHTSGKKKAHFTCMRLDQIKEVTILSDEKTADSYFNEQLSEYKQYVWGVSFAPMIPGRAPLQKVILTIHADENKEAYIIQRLLREGEGGTVNKTDINTFRYEKTVKDAMEMFPWIRSFTGRIADMKIYATDGERLLEENKTLEKIFFSDLERSYLLYGI